MMIDDDHMDHLLFSEKGIPHAYVPEHAVEMFRLLPHAQIAILPGTDHMAVVKRALHQMYRNMGRSQRRGRP